MGNQPSNRKASTGSITRLIVGIAIVLALVLGAIEFLRPRDLGSPTLTGKTAATETGAATETAADSELDRLGANPSLQGQAQEIPLEQLPSALAQKPADAAPSAEARDSQNPPASAKTVKSTATTGTSERSTKNSKKASRIATAPATATEASSATMSPSGCRIARFVHAATKGHANTAVCSKHLNSIALSSLLQSNSLRADSLCVRADGNAVTHEWNGQRLLVAAGAGPGSEITVRYCAGKGACPALGTSCQPRQDRFMAAIGAARPRQELGAAADAARWRAGAADEDIDLDQELAGLPTGERRRAGAGNEVFDGWVLRSTSACGERN